MGAFAEFERSIIRDPHAKGIAIARQKYTYKGRVRVLDPGRVAAVKDRIAVDVNRVKGAREFGISRSTLYAYLNAGGV
jgi:DNA invertase Pin-like site-specific DNA recombinase